MTGVDDIGADPFTGEAARGWPAGPHAALSLECIGDDAAQALRGFYPWPRPWVARLTDIDFRFGFAREFLRGRKDYAQANSVGSRGVYLHFLLPPGVYEVFEMTAWQNNRRYFALSEGGCVTEITRQEAKRWLLNH